MEWLDLRVTGLAKVAVRLSAMVALALLAACATPPPESDPAGRQAYYEANDPLEPLNRGIWAFNRGFDTVLLKPVATVYRDVVPRPIQTGVRNVLDNLRQPLNMANAALQGDRERFGNAMGRFFANSLIGIGGIFDVLPNVPKAEEDFGQTLAVWGAGEGPYLMLPFLGPSNPRDFGGFVVDAMADPFNRWANRNDQFWFPVTRTALNVIDVRSRNIATLDEIEAQSIDFYATVRSLYRQRRNDEIRNGALPSKPAVGTPLVELERDDSISRKPVASN
jgi:phospholipid-binding lipoprotein MlaA